VATSSRVRRHIPALLRPTVSSFIPVRIPPRLCPAFEVPVHVFGFAELFKAFFAELAAAAAEFEAAEGRGIVIGQGIVDPERADLNLFKEAFGLEGIVGVEVGSQIVLAVVRQSKPRSKSLNFKTGISHQKAICLPAVVRASW
jgi:hypothetical protein